MHVLLHNTQTDNLIFVRGSILIKVHIVHIWYSVVDKPLIDGKYLHWASANTHYSNMDSESYMYHLILSFRKGHQKFCEYC